MAINKQPWQATVNTASLSKTVEKENSLTVVKKASFEAKNPLRSYTKVISTRYSFDDNGGSYRGL